MTVLREKMFEDFAIRKALVIAPLRVAEDTWSREAEKWDHLSDLRISKVLGSAKQREAALDTPADIYVINRENVQWLVEHYGHKWPFDAVVIDELSSFKSSSSKRFRLLKRVIAMCFIVWGLTGTPAANGYMDLFAEMFLIDQGVHLGRTLTQYRDRFFTPGARKGHIVFEWKLKPGAKDRIDALLSELCLSMSAKDWLQLPERIDVDHFVQMSRPERRIYDQFQKEKVLPLLKGQLTESFNDADTAVLGSTAATVSGKLLQMANGAVYDDQGGVFHIHDAKLDALEEIVEAAAGDPILLFYNFRHDIDRIQDRIKGTRVLKDSKDIADWNSGAAGIKVMLCHPASVSYGLNLQEGGHIIVWFGPIWSLELYQQANARLLRQGQTKPVIIHHIQTENTLDQKVMAALDKKDNVQKALLDALKEYLNV